VRSEPCITDPHKQGGEMIGTRRLELLTSTVSKLIYSIPLTTYTTAGDRPNPWKYV
jgi:hypothetical protein